MLSSTFLYNENRVMSSISWFIFLLDTTKLSRKGLETSFCMQSIFNLGGYSQLSSRSFICSTVKPENIFQYSKSRR